MPLIMLKKWRLLIAVVVCGSAGLLMTYPGRPEVLKTQFLLVPNYDESVEDVIFKQRREEKLGKFKELISKHQNSSLISNEIIQTLLEMTLLDKPNNLLSKQKPMQIIIVTAPRSGSTFLTELFSSHPGVFIYYEPLMRVSEKRIYKGDNSYREAFQFVESILKCGIRNSILFKKIMNSYIMLPHIPRLLHLCYLNKENRKLCSQKDFFDVVCSMFPWHLVKLVNAGVDLFEPLLEDQSLNPHLIFLARDPRAVINSRSSWRSFHLSVYLDPSLTCRHMERDFDAFLKLRKKYPDRVHILRYEDLARDPSGTFQQLLKNIGWDYHPAIDSYIKSHTVKEKDFYNPISTFRDSAYRALSWVTRMNETAIFVVQNTCYKVMSKLGYLPIISRDQLLKLRSFNNSLVDSINRSFIKVSPSIYETLYRDIRY